jgi:DNA-binding CsgD family transcriptional regulator
MNEHVDIDREAIVQVIEAETDAYFAKDFDAWARCWVHAPHVRRWAWLPHCGIVLIEGWDAVSSTMRMGMQRFPAPNASTDEVRRVRLSVSIGVDMAWVTFDQYAPATGDPFDVAGRQHQMRILEKRQGVWRIACVGILQPWLESADYPLLRVDADAKVLWMNAAAKERLGDHGLTISAGRLRARDRTGNKGLQASIRWAAGAIGFIQGQQAAWRAVSTTRGALPVVLGEGDAGEIHICWVAADSSMILVSFDDGHRTDQCLAAAAVVYGLSPGQMRLAALVVAGHDLAGAAERLGISVNTARTHLQRMFDKTGVRSQPALVRVLLSAVAPAG